MTLHESIPETITATMVLAITQEIACVFVLCDLITLFFDTSSTENPYQSTLLAHLICFWSLITIFCFVLDTTLVVFGFIFHSRLIRERTQAMHPDDVDVENEAPYHSEHSRLRAVDNGSLRSYGSFVGRTANHDYDHSPHGSPWVFKRDWWLNPAALAAPREQQQQQPERRPDRSHHADEQYRRVTISVPHQVTSNLAPPPRSTSPEPISGLQTELSDADDEIDMLEEDLIDLAGMHAEANDVVPTLLPAANRGRRDGESRRF